MTKEIRTTYFKDLRIEKEASEAFREELKEKEIKVNPITELNISLYEIDSSQQIDETRKWSPVLEGDIDPDQAVFVGFYAGDSPPVAEEIEYTDDGYGEEAFWVYKTEFTIKDLLNGDITPQELIKDVMEEQPHIEIAGLCKYVRDIPPE